MIVYFQIFDAYRKWAQGRKADGDKSIKAALKSADSIGNEYIKLSVYIELGNRQIDSAKAPSYFSKALAEATAYNFPVFKSLFAEGLYDYYRNVHDIPEAMRYAVILMDAQQKQRGELKKYGFNVVNFVKNDMELKTTRTLEHNRTLLMLVFIGLFVMSIGLLFFVIRSYRVSKQYAGVQKRLAEESSARSNALENWNVFYDMLLSILAHDLRQPFSAIIMVTQLMKSSKHAISDKEIEILMLELNDTATKSVELLEGLLYWVKSKKEDFEYKTQPIELQDNIDHANGLYTFEQNNKQVTVLNEVPSELIIYAHAQMLLFINRNLISNATKYSPKGGKIIISAKVKGNETIVGFKDQGPGMTQEQVKKLFRIDENIKPERELMNGAGIALSICYDMIKQMNGRLWVETELGKGATFFYALYYNQNE